jgi:hypothetical protein
MLALNTNKIYYYSVLPFYIIIQLLTLFIIVYEYDATTTTTTDKTNSRAKLHRVNSSEAILKLLF